MDRQQEIQTYIKKGLERIAAETIRGGLADPRGGVFMMRFAAAAKAAEKRRAAAAVKGVQVPPFLAACVTEREADNTAKRADRVETAPLGAEAWLEVFDRADRMGVSVIMLTGGEPLLRRDVLKMAARKQNVLFPVLTGGTPLDEKYESQFDRYRNLMPVLVFAGDRAQTDAVRGAGAYDRLQAQLARFGEMGLCYGAAFAVTAENLETVTAKETVQDLAGRGCKMVVYLTDGLPQEEEKKLEDAVQALRAKLPRPMLLVFPQDLAAAFGTEEDAADRFLIDVHGRCGSF